MNERTLVIIKPDGVKKGVAGKILQRYRDNDLLVVWQREGVMPEGLASKFYEEHRDKFFFEGLLLSMTSGPSIYVVLEGWNAIALVRDLNGVTNPANALPGTIRHDFRSAGGPFNTVHGSDSASAAQHEIALLYAHFK